MFLQNKLFPVGNNIIIASCRLRGQRRKDKIVLYIYETSNIQCIIILL